MNEKDMKKKIKQAYEKQNIDLLSKIEASCQAEKQASPAQSTLNKSFAFSRAFKHIIASVVCLALFVTGLGIGFIIPNNKGESNIGFNDSIETLVYLDVNPSIELQVNSESKIVSCIPANEDASIILNGLELKGVDMNTALTAIIGSMHVNGYLSTDSNSILVSVNTSDKEKETIILDDITERINKVFEKSDMECSVIAQGVEIDEDLKQRAKENGVSVGKMHFVDQIIEQRDDFCDDDRSDLSNMSIKELDGMLAKKPIHGEDNPTNGDLDDAPSFPGNDNEMDEDFGSSTQKPNNADKESDAAQNESESNVPNSESSSIPDDEQMNKPQEAPDNIPDQDFEIEQDKAPQNRNE